MEFYCGIDLHARRSQICVVDADGNKVFERKRVPNDLEEILGHLQPFREGLKIVVESTFNWYWLVDGLQDAGCDVTLAHTFGLFVITKAKVKTDRRDAYRLARLLRANEIHAAYIYPKETRPIRDLVRQRTRVVSFRAREYANTRMRLYQHGILDHTRNSARSIDRCMSSSRCVDRSRHIDCFVRGSSKNAGTGNCCTVAPYASPNRCRISLA